MAKTIESGILRGRPFGGVMIMINNALRNVTETVFCCDRYAVVRVANCVIVNLYLPCVGTDNRLLVCEEILADSWGWCERFPDCNYVLAGDFNAYLDKSDCVTDHINSFISQHNLYRCDKLFGKHDLFTYDNLALNQRSVIDYFITSSAECILDYTVLDPGTNFSDHNPITVSCKIAPLADNNNMNGHTHCNTNSSYKKLRWDKADRVSFYSYTGIAESLSGICDEAINCCNGSMDASSSFKC